MKRRARPKHKPKRAPRRLRTRRPPVIPEAGLVLPVAFSEFSRKGYQRASLGQIAKLLGVGPHTIARRYATKDALALALLEWQVGQALKSFPRAAPPEPTAAKLERALDAFVRCCVENNGMISRLTLELWRALSRDSEARLRLSWIHAQWQALLQEILEGGVSTGELRATLEPSVAAAALIAACEGMALRWVMLGGATPPDSFGTSLARLITAR